MAAEIGAECRTGRNASIVRRRSRIRSNMPDCTDVAEREYSRFGILSRFRARPNGMSRLHWRRLSLRGRDFAYCNLQRVDARQYFARLRGTCGPLLNVDLHIVYAIVDTGQSWVDHVLNLHLQVVYAIVDAGQS